MKRLQNIISTANRKWQRGDYGWAIHPIVINEDAIYRSMKELHVSYGPAALVAVAEALEDKELFWWHDVVDLEYAGMPGIVAFVEKTIARRGLESGVRKHRAQIDARRKAEHDALPQWEREFIEADRPFEPTGRPGFVMEWGASGAQGLRGEHLWRAAFEVYQKAYSN